MNKSYQSNIKVVFAMADGTRRLTTIGTVEVWHSDYPSLCLTRFSMKMGAIPLPDESNMIALRLDVVEQIIYPMKVNIFNVQEVGVTADVNSAIKAAVSNQVKIEERADSLARPATDTEVSDWHS